MGYGEEQVRDLEMTIDRVPCDTVVIGTPIDLRRVLKIAKPSVRVSYALEELTKPDIPAVLDEFLKRAGHRRSSGSSRRSR
jgi:predicted GTPase